MIAVRTRAFRVWPRRARRVFKMAWTPKNKTARERSPRLSILESFEKMFESQVEIMLRDVEF